MKYNEQKIQAEILLQQSPELSVRDIAKKLNCSTRTVYRYKKKLNEQDNQDTQEPLDKKNPKILIWDLEFSPCIIASFGIYKQNIQPKQVIRDMSLLTWSAKWLYSSKVFSDRVSTEEAKAGKDSSIINRLWSLLDKADVAIGFNSKRYDHKKINSVFIRNGLLEPSPFLIIDLFSEIKKKFSFTSNGLDFVNRILGLQQKDHTSLDLWIQCISGDDSALREMEAYNRQDVNITEMLYEKLLPYIKHPGLYVADDDNNLVCPSCGGTNLKEDGIYSTNLSKYQSLRCQDCGSLSRSKMNLLSKEQRTHQLISI